MKRVRHLATLVRIGLSVALITLCGCMPLAGGPYGPYNTGPGPVPNLWLGRIAAVDGPNAFVQTAGSGSTAAAVVGQLLYARDRFFTGQDTHMLIQFNGGGQVELDENTDPTLLQELNCLVISLFRSGQMFVDKSNVCVDTLQVASSQHSRVMYSVMPGSLPGVQITVFEGQAELLRPTRALIPAGWRIDANAGGILGTGRAYPLSPEELQRSIRWLRLLRSVRVIGTGSFFPAPLPPAGLTVPPIRSGLGGAVRLQPLGPGQGSSESQGTALPGAPASAGSFGTRSGAPNTAGGTSTQGASPPTGNTGAPNTRATRDGTVMQRAQRARQPEPSGVIR